MELLRKSCSPDTFLFYTTKLDSIASSPETTLLAHRFGKKNAAHFRIIIDHNLTDDRLNQQAFNTNASNNDIPSNVTHNASTSTVTGKRSRRKTKPANIHLDHSCYQPRPVALYLLLIYHVDILPYTMTYQLAGSFSRHLRLFTVHAISRVLFGRKQQYSHS